MRTIYDSWEVSQDKPSPFEPVKFQQEDICPWETVNDYIKWINMTQPLASHRYDEYHNMPGRYVFAEVVNDVLWVTFSPEKLGKYWVILQNDKNGGCMVIE